MTDQVEIAPPVQVLVHRNLNQQQAQVITEKIRSSMSDLMMLVSKAWHGRVWIALGYESWADYIKGEFEHAPLSLPREERAAVSALLRGQGMSTRAIAPALGVHHDTVASDLSPVGNPTPQPEAVPVTGLDGKTYQRKPKPGPTADDRAHGEAHLINMVTSVLEPVLQHIDEFTPAAKGHLLQLLRSGVQAISVTAQRDGATRFSKDIQKLSASIADQCRTLTDDEIAEALGAAQFLYELLRGETILRAEMQRHLGTLSDQG